MPWGLFLREIYKHFWDANVPVNRILPSITIVTNPKGTFSNIKKHTSIVKHRVLSHFSGRKMSQIFSGSVRLIRKACINESTVFSNQM